MGSNPTVMRSAIEQKKNELATHLAELRAEAADTRRKGKMAALVLAGAYFLLKLLKLVFIFRRRVVVKIGKSSRR